MTAKEQFELLKSTLGFSGLEELQSELDNYLQEKNDDNTLANTIAESRFSEGLKCPHCESKQVNDHVTQVYSMAEFNVIFSGTQDDK